jgi:hypothetical protein
LKRYTCDGRGPPESANRSSPSTIRPEARRYLGHGSDAASTRRRCRRAARVPLGRISSTTSAAHAVASPPGPSQGRSITGSVSPQQPVPDGDSSTSAVLSVRTYAFPDRPSPFDDAHAARRRRGLPQGTARPAARRQAQSTPVCSGIGPRSRCEGDVAPIRSRGTSRGSAGVSPSSSGRARRARRSPHRGGHRSSGRVRGRPRSTRGSKVPPV